MNTKTILVIIFLFLSVSLFSQRIIENPAYEIRNSAIPQVTKVTLYEDSTVLDIRFNFKPGWWIMLDSIPYIKCNGQDLPYKSISGCKTGQKVTTPECGYIESRITFDAIPSDSKKFDLDMSGTFTIYGIDISGQNSVSDKVILPAGYHGIWKRFSETDNVMGEPEMIYKEIGLFKDVAVIEEEIWKYNKITSRKGRCNIVLSNMKTDEERTLYICSGKDGSLKIGDNKKSALTYVKEFKEDITKKLFPEYAVDNFFNVGKSTLKGYISGYSANANVKVFSTHRFSIFNDVFADVLAINIDESGYFEVDIPVEHLCEINLDQGLNSTYIEPGKTVCLILDWESMLNKAIDSKYLDDISFVSDSYLGTLNNEFRLVQSKVSAISSKFMDKCLKECSIEQCVLKTDSAYNDKAVKLHNVCDENKISSMTRSILEHQYTIDLLYQKISYPGHRKRLLGDDNMSEDIDFSYYDFQIGRAHV